MKILITADGGPCAERALLYLLSHDAWRSFRNEYTVLHCVPPLPDRAESALGAEGARGYYEAEAEQALGPVRQLCQARGLEAPCWQRKGEPSEVIAAYAEKGQFDLIVMGARHFADARGLSGSVVAEVMARCRVPVLLVQ
jgi:nucleotide-binding universal stress UspA family protein